MTKLFVTTLLLAFFIFGTSVQAQQSSDRYASWNNTVAHKQVKKKAIRVATKVKKVIKKRQPRYYNPNLASRTLIADVITAASEPIRQVAHVIGGRPQGCPYRFCGCALSIKLFGRIIPRLNLAANWLNFPRATPAPGMVAARRGHVFKLIKHIQGSKWLVWDANSGGGRIRIHHRSIARYVIVNPILS